MNEFELAYYYRINPVLTFNLLVLEYHDLIYSCIHKTCYRFDSGAFSIEDCFQESLLILTNTMDSFREDKFTSFSTYLFYCISSRVRGFVRSIRGFYENSPLHFDSLSNGLTSESEMTLEDTVASKDYFFDPVMMANYFEAQNIVQESVGLYDLTTQKVFYLRNQGYSYSDISTEIGISEKKVDNVLQKIRRNLK